MPTLRQYVLDQNIHDSIKSLIEESDDYRTLNDFQSRAIIDFINKRSDGIYSKHDYLVPASHAKKRINVYLDIPLLQKVNAIAESDGVTIRAALHTSIMKYAANCNLLS